MLKLFFFLIIFLNSNDLEIKTKTIEDFETKTYQKEDFQIHSNKPNDLKVWTSEQLISPNSTNEKSLIIQIKSINSKIPIELIFKEPYSFEEHIISFEFLVYSNSASGRIYFYFDDTKFQRHKILICNFEKEGWKKLKVNLPENIIQKNYSHLKHTKTKLVGFIFSSELNQNKDLILGIDDIKIEYKSKFITKF